MKNKLIISIVLIITLLVPFTVSNRSDTISPEILSDSTIGFYQSSTCKISLIEFYFKNRNNNLDLFFNLNDYADIKCFGKITGVDKLSDSYMVSIGTNTSINLILQSSIWFLLFLLIPKIKSKTKFSIKYSFIIPFLFILQYFGEDKFYTRTNILHTTNFSIKNFYLVGLFIFFFLCCFILLDIFQERYLNIINYLPYVFLIIGTYSGMNINIYLLIGVFFGVQSLFINRELNRFDFLYLLFSIIWLLNTENNNHFFDGDKLRGFTNSSYNLVSQIFWILLFYFLIRGIIFLVHESIPFFNLDKLMKNSLISSSLIVFFGFLGSKYSLFNFLQFYIFGQNKRSMKEFTSIDGNTWRGFASSAESIGEFYGFTILIFIFCLIYKNNKLTNPYSLLLLPTLYGLYRANNFASILSLIFIILIFAITGTSFYKKNKIFILSGMVIFFLFSLISYLYVQDYDYLSTELVYEATLHQNFYSGPNSYSTYIKVQEKMIERDLNTLLNDPNNFIYASNGYKFIVRTFTPNFNIPLVPNVVAIISIISLLINRTEMWGIFIAKYNPNFLESIFGYGPLQLNGYLYNHKVRLDVPIERLEALYLPHSSFLNILIFFGVFGLSIFIGFFVYLLIKREGFSLFKILSIFLLINFLKSDSLLYLNSFLLLTFCLSSFYYEKSDLND